MAGARAELKASTTSSADAVTDERQCSALCHRVECLVRQERSAPAILTGSLDLDRGEAGNGLRRSREHRTT